MIIFLSCVQRKPLNDCQNLIASHMMYSLLQLALTLVISSLTTPATAECVVEWDSENVVATQLEGSWALNLELSLVLNAWAATTTVIGEIK